MENVYYFFQPKKRAATREVSCVIDDILTQRADFTPNITDCHQLAGSALWLLNKLEEQHLSRSGQQVDLSKDPLLLILELSAYYYDCAKRGRSSVTNHDGFLAELEGAQKGVALIAAYTRWFDCVNKVENVSAAILVRNPKELTAMREQYKLNRAVDLATQFADSKKFGPCS